MNFMLESVKRDWEGLFDSWNMPYEFTCCYKENIEIATCRDYSTRGKGDKVKQRFCWKE